VSGFIVPTENDLPPPAAFPNRYPKVDK
jgi:hypothetical protein